MTEVTTKPRACRICGCTDERACARGCYWIGPDLCSQCHIGKGDLDDLHYGAGGLARLVKDLHRRNRAAGWWTDLHTGEPLKRNVGELLCLVHSEISEAMEGHRKNLMDDKLPHRPMIEVELADAVIRICDIAGGLGLDLAGALVEKTLYNAKRDDHKAEVRKLAGGKAY